MKNKLIIPLLILVIATAGCVGANQSSGTQQTATEKTTTTASTQPSGSNALPSGFELYENDYYSIGYPSDWAPKYINEQQYGFVGPTAYGASLNVVAGPSDEVVDLEAVAKKAIDLLKVVFEDFQLLGNSKTTLVGVKAQRIEYTASGSDGTSFRFVQIISTRGGVAYTITYGGNTADFEKISPIAEKMVASFAFK